MYIVGSKQLSPSDLPLSQTLSSEPLPKTVCSIQSVRAFFLLLNMDLPVLIAGTICLLVITWCLECAIKRFQARHRTRSVSRQVIRSDPAACAQILACTGYNNTGAINLYSHVKSRAIPNERLVRAFEIDNSFTTSEAKRRMEFNSEARKAIRMTEAKVCIFSLRSLRLTSFNNYCKNTKTPYLALRSG